MTFQRRGILSKEMSGRKAALNWLKEREINQLGYKKAKDLLIKGRQGIAATVGF